MTKPILDPEFKPAIIELRKFKELVNGYANKQHLAIAVERDQGYIHRVDFDILPDGINDELNIFICERYIKSILWVTGGFRIYIGGSKKVYEAINSYYKKDGLRAFDYEFFSTCYEREVEVVEKTLDEMPKENKQSVALGGHLNGKRIGFDAGGSDRKTSAVVNGEVIFSEEVVWAPKQSVDINYQYNEIYAAFKSAVDKMGGDCDAVGVSTAGVIIDSRPMVSSIFIKIPKCDYEQVKMAYVANIHRLEKELGHPISYVIANDGDVTAIAGANDLHDNCVLGIAMGTSEAVGYVNSEGNLNGWLSELAFCPVDFNKNAMVDEWSHDYGVGCKYFSQDAVIKLAPKAGIELDKTLSLGEQLKVVQSLMNNNHDGARKIYESIGVYLAYSIAYYSEFYKIKHLMLMGRVMSGLGGDIIIEVARETLKKEFPEYASINLCTPSEYMRRVGQSIAAASMPVVK